MGDDRDGRFRSIEDEGVDVAAASSGNPIDMGKAPDVQGLIRKMTQRKDRNIKLPFKTEAFELHSLSVTATHNSLLIPVLIKIPGTTAHRQFIGFEKNPGIERQVD